MNIYIKLNLLQKNNINKRYIKISIDNNTIIFFTTLTNLYNLRHFLTLFYFVFIIFYMFILFLILSLTILLLMLMLMLMLMIILMLMLLTLINLNRTSILSIFYICSWQCQFSCYWCLSCV